MVAPAMVTVSRVYMRTVSTRVMVTVSTRGGATSPFDTPTVVVGGVVRWAAAVETKPNVSAAAIPNFDTIRVIVVSSHSAIPIRPRGWPAGFVSGVLRLLPPDTSNDEHRRGTAY